MTGAVIRRWLPASAPQSGFAAILAASAADNWPRENNRPWSIDSQPLKIQVSTKVAVNRPRM